MVPEDRARVFADRLMRTFLVDGFVAGSWRLEGATLRVEPFRKLNATDSRAVQEEGRRLLAFVAPEGSAPDVQLVAPDPRS
jgi:hypothetical protein